MSSYGKYRIVKMKGEGEGDYEIARDFLSPRGLDLAFGSTIRFRKDYDVLLGFYDTPEEAYQKLLSLQQLLSSQQEGQK